MGKKQKTSHKITNWKAYNESLVCRGDITLWFDEAAIETLLMLRELFRLPTANLLVIE